MSALSSAILENALLRTGAPTGATGRESATSTPCNNMGVKNICDTNIALEDSFLMIKHKKGIIVKVPQPDSSIDIRLSLVDWVSFTFSVSKFINYSYCEARFISDFSSELKNIFGFGVTEKRKAGLNFYSSSFELGVNNWGQLCVGGQNGTCLVTIKGQGLLHAQKGWESKLILLLEQLQANITRVDLACDLFYSKYTLDDFLQSYNDGLFKVLARSPSVELRGDWVNKDDQKGRTLYIGKKQSGKLLRIYEKGKQLGGTFSTLYSDWVRVELELSNKGRTIPYSVLSLAGQYLAGAYPALSFLYEIQSKVKTNKKISHLDLDRSLKIVRHQFGAYIFAFNELYGAQKTIEILTNGKEKIPPRLNAVNDINNFKSKLEGNYEN